MKKIGITVFLGIFITLGVLLATLGGMYLFMDNTAAKSINNDVTVYFFRGEGCPHCSEAERFFSTIINDYDYLNVKMFEVWDNDNNKEFMKKVAEEFDMNASAVPFIIIGNTYHDIGYSSSLDEKLLEVINDAHIDNDYTDVVEKILQNKDFSDVVMEEIERT